MLKVPGWSWRRRGARLHLSDDDLLLYLDGEAAPNRGRKIEEHVKSCWGCRARLHEIEQAVTGFVKLRTALLDSPAAAPPKGWREFEYRLGELDAHAGGSPLTVRLSSALSALWPVRKPVPVGFAALALTIVYVWLVLPPSTASAKEVLARAGDAEARMASRVSGPVLYQKLRVRRTAPKTTFREETVEVWSDAARQRLAHRGEDHLWRELDQVLEANRLAAKPLVSARTFASWRSAVRVKREHVETGKSPEGAPAMLVRTTASGPYRENQIVEGELLVRAADSLPLNQTWQVQGQDGLRQYELQAVEQSVLARNAVDPLLLGDVPAAVARAVVSLPPLPSAIPAPAAPAAVTAGDPEAIEIEARYVLHRRGDCLAGLIQVQRGTGGKVVVRGLAETARLRDELIAALPRSPLLSVNIEVIDEWKPGEMPARASEPAGEIPAQVRNQEIPVADLLRSRMAERYGADAPQRIAALANEAVILSGTMRTEGWALRRLAERYGAASAAPLPRSAQWMLEAMVREHLLRLRAEASRGVHVFEPVWQAIGHGPTPRAILPPAPQLSSSAWRECLRVAQRVEEIDALIQELFTASGRPVDRVESGIETLQAAFAGLETDFQEVEARLAPAATGEKP